MVSSEQDRVKFRSNVIPNEVRNLLFPKTPAAKADISTPLRRGYPELVEGLEMTTPERLP